MTIILPLNNCKVCCLLPHTLFFIYFKTFSSNQFLFNKLFLFSLHVSCTPCIYLQFKNFFKGFRKKEGIACSTNAYFSTKGSIDYFRSKKQAAFVLTCHQVVHFNIFKWFSCVKTSFESWAMGNE